MIASTSRPLPKADTALPSRATDQAAVPGASIVIKGNIVVSKDDFYFGGQLEGAIDAVSSTVTIGLSARVIGNIKARRLIILGNVQGDAAAVESIELGKASNLAGNMVTSRISIQDGAYFKGSIDIRQAGDQTPPSPKSDALERRYATG